MLPTIFGRRRAERFARLLDQTDALPTDGDLHDTVAVARAVSQGSERFAPAPSHQFRQELRAMLIAEAELQRKAAAAAAAEPTHVLPIRARRARPAPVLGVRSRRGRRTRAAVIVGLAAGTLAVSGISVASGSAMPGDTLYGVKRSSEDARMALAGSDRDRGMLYLQFARNRMGEARGVSGTAGLFGVLGAMDQDTAQGTALLTAAALRQGDASLLGPLAQFVVDQRRELAELAGVSPDVRRLTTESVDLLGKVITRIDVVRAAIACHAAYHDDGQSLGPTVQPCG